MPKSLSIATRGIQACTVRMPEHGSSLTRSKELQTKTQLRSTLGQRRSTCEGRILYIYIYIFFFNVCKPQKAKGYLLSIYIYIPQKVIKGLPTQLLKLRRTRQSPRGLHAGLGGRSPHRPGASASRDPRDPLAIFVEAVGGLGFRFFVLGFGV